MSEYEDNMNRLRKNIGAIKNPVAVFDIGTRASRCAVGPRNEMAKDFKNWKDLFCNVGLKTMLGKDVPEYGGTLLIRSSNGLRETIKVINGCLEILKPYNLGPDDIVAVGTEVFRKIRNIDEVLAYIKNNTGLSIHVLTDLEEANISLFITMITYKKNLDVNLELKDGQKCLVLDQGGGSLEVGIFSKSDGKYYLESKSVASLGTISMRELFFHNEKNSDDYCKGGDNKASIYGQHERVLRYIDERLDEQLKGDLSFVMKHKGEYGLAYGLGSAISKVVRGSDSDRHNKTLAIDKMDNKVSNAREKLEKGSGKVGILYNVIQELGTKTDPQSVQFFNELDEWLTIIYGLPVYRKILERLNLNEIRAQGYGLKYGVYLLWHLYGSGFDLKPRLETTDAGSKLPPIIIGSQPITEPEKKLEKEVVNEEKNESKISKPLKTLLEWAGGDEVILGIVFTDIVGGSSLREDYGNTKMIKDLNAHAKKAREFIKKNCGWLVKQNDDSLVVVFKNASDSLKFAQALYKTTGVKNFKMRAGINVGLVHIVPSGTLVFDIDGAGVVKAHRVIEQIGKGHGIWISNEVFAHVVEKNGKAHGRANWKSEGEFEVKGAEGLQTFYSMISSENKRTKIVKAAVNKKDISYKDPISLTREEQLNLLEDVLSLDENLNLEFKATARYDTRLKKVNPVLEKLIVETVAQFLNSEGGCLVIGVNDSKDVTGLFDDYNTLQKKNADGYVGYLSQLFDNSFSKDIGEFLRIYVCKKNEKDVCMILADKSTKPIYVKAGEGDILFTRGPNGRKKHKTSEAVSYTEIHWPIIRKPWNFLNCFKIEKPG